MQDINIFIKENIPSVFKKKLFLAPEIPEKKLNNAAKSMKLTDSVNSILALYDDTLFGSADDGMAFTGEKMTFKPLASSVEVVVFDELDSAEYVRNVTVNEKGKEKVEEYTLIKLSDKREVKISGLQHCNYEKLALFLNQISSEFESFVEEDQLIALAEMPEELKIAYVKIIINMAYSDDKIIDENEFAQILLLMTRLELEPKSRSILRTYITSLKELDSVKDLIDILDENCSPSHNKSVKISLVKDLFSIFMSTNDGKHEGFEFFNEYNHLFSLSEEEVELIIEALELDFKMLNKDFDDDALKKGMKELGAKAGAVGVPLAAVYLSGSVVGMSAAGLTSGLATLGLGGALGFSSMATGIGVAVLIGVGAYKGIKHLTGANELDKVKRRELMLTEVIKQTQMTVSLLMEDLNYLTTELNQAVKLHGESSALVRDLIEKVAVFTKVGGVLSEKSESTQTSCYKLKCPSVLDIEKLKDLTRDATKQKIFDVVISYYEEKTVTKEVDGKQVTENIRALKDGISMSKMESLAKIFENIGYYDVGEVLKGKLTGIFS